MEKIATIALVPSSGLSHLIPLVEFAKTLVLHHPEFHVTFLIPTLGSPSPSMKAILNSLPPTIHFTLLPQVNLEDLPQNLHPATKIKLTITHSLPFLHEAIASLISQTHLVALVFDLFTVDALDVAKQFNLLAYMFFDSGAIALSCCLSMPKLDESVPSDSELKDLKELFKVQGCDVAFHGRDLPDPVLSGRSSEMYTSFVSACRKFSFVDGIMMNTFRDLEEGTIRALQEANNPPVYPVGPIIQTQSSSQVNGPRCMTWLDDQPPNSVLYVSFGSRGTLSQDQLNELAVGLESSGHKFLWVVRVPSQSASSAYIVGQNEDPLHYLPSGFLDKTKEQGLVVPSWAPQIEILRHASTGGFLTHCGWNSILESVVHSVPMIAWPLFAEQRMNAIVLTDLLKVAVRPKFDETDGIIKREEIAKAIKRIMEEHEGLEIRKRISDLSAAAAVALSEHGSSKKTLSSIALKWQKI